MSTGRITRRDAPYRAGETALLVVDMQRIWLEPGANPSRPDWGDEHPFHVQIREHVIPRQTELLPAARAAGVEVLYTIIRSLTQDGRDRSLDHKLTPIHVTPDDPMALMPASIQPREDEIVLPKTSSGVFNSTNIDYVLRNLGIAQLIVMGVMTDQCIDMAVRDAADRGYAVTCVADACAAKTPEAHDTALGAFGGYCWIATAAEVEDRLRSIARS